MRLAAAGAAPPDIEAVVRRLHAHHYLDDRRFAADSAERAARRGRGSEYVRATLAGKGVAEALVDAAVAAAFADEIALARRVVAERFAAVPERATERAKAARFLNIIAAPRVMFAPHPNQQVCYASCGIFPQLGRVHNVQAFW